MLQVIWCNFRFTPRYFALLSSCQVYIILKINDDNPSMLGSEEFAKKVELGGQALFLDVGAKCGILLA